LQENLKLGLTLLSVLQGLSLKFSFKDHSRDPGFQGILTGEERLGMTLKVAKPVSEPVACNNGQLNSIMHTLED